MCKQISKIDKSIIKGLDDKHKDKLKSVAIEIHTDGSTTFMLIFEGNVGFSGVFTYNKPKYTALNCWMRINANHIVYFKCEYMGKLSDDFLGGGNS